MEGTKIFVDTGAYFAQFYQRNQYHEQAMERWKNLKKHRVKFFITHHIMVELATLLARRTDNEFTFKKLEKVYNSDVFIELTTENDERNVMKLLKKYSDQRAGIVDCLSFVVMKRLGLKQVFTFDRHFEHAEFKAIPLLYK